MLNNMFKNKDLFVFCVAMIIAACDLLSSGFFAIQEVIAAPAQMVASAASPDDVVTQRWVERMARISAR